jgi:hypothetical protein
MVFKTCLKRQNERPRLDRRRSATPDRAEIRRPPNSIVVDREPAALATIPPELATQTVTVRVACDLSDHPRRACTRLLVRALVDASHRRST